jgi:hypothetical protein
MLNDMLPFQFDENLPHAPENARLNPLQFDPVLVWSSVPRFAGRFARNIANWPPEGGTPNSQPASTKTVSRVSIQSGRDDSPATPLAWFRNRSFMRAGSRLHRAASNGTLATLVAVHSAAAHEAAPGCSP